MRWLAMMVMCLLGAWVVVAPASEGAEGAADAGARDGGAEAVVRVGKVVLGDEGVVGSDMDVCFSAGFLATLARETGIEVQRHFERTKLGSDELFDYPFVVLAGQGSFTLSEPERRRLSRYIRRGGFVLASAGCSNAPWGQSFAAEVERVLGEGGLRPLAMDHPIFHMIYEIEQVEVVIGDPEQALLGYEVDGVLRLVFSPVGLNDTDRVGAGCCCCGGQEIRNARMINTNILAYALTH